MTCLRDLYLIGTLMPTNNMIEASHSLNRLCSRLRWPNTAELLVHLSVHVRQRPQLHIRLHEDGFMSGAFLTRRCVTAASGR